MSLFEYTYDSNVGEITNFKSVSGNSFYYNYLTKDTSDKIIISLYYADMFEGSNTKFHENWIISDELGNQLSLNGIVPSQGNGITTNGTYRYIITGKLGEVWEKVNRVEIKYNQDKTRNIIFYEV